MAAVAALLLPLLGCDGSPHPVPATVEGPVTLGLFDDRTATLPDAAKRGVRSMEARAADFDADGDLDLLVAREEGTNLLLLNDGTGVFSDASDRLPRDVHDHEDIAVADFDNDGDLDAIVVAEDDKAKDFYLNDGKARFTNVPDRIPQRCSSDSVAAADLDGDRDIDVVIGCSGREMLLLNDGSGRFDDALGRIPSCNWLRDITQDVAIGDVDRDGDPDLVIGNEDDNCLLLNDGRAEFQLAAAGALPLRENTRWGRLVGRFVEETRNVDLGDVDQDGDLDILFSNVNWNDGNDPQDRLLLNDGRGTFQDSGTTRLPRETLTTIDQDFADIDADGDLDIVAVHTDRAERHRMLINQGNGQFVDETTRYFPSSLRGDGIEVEIADFTGDGRLDLYFATYTGGDQLLIQRFVPTPVPKISHP